MRALVIVPPFIKSTSGPQLGPAMLRGAVERRGHAVDVLDLAIREVRHRVPEPLRVRPSGLAGDHDKNEDALRAAQSQFATELADPSGIAARRMTRAELEWSELDEVVRGTLVTSWGARTADALRAARRPSLVGVSVMFADQVVPALAITDLVRTIWPGMPVVWGGAHVTALAPEIGAEPRYGRGIDGFVAGYAERTFGALLDAISRGSDWPPEVFRAGSGTFHRAEGDLFEAPSFPALEAYGAPRLSLPAQLTRGCAYGKCGFCTYPYVEGGFIAPSVGRPLAHVEPVVTLAEKYGAVVSFKDALMTPPNLRRVAALIAGRVRWSACTKLAPGLVDMLPKLAASGCETLEVGLETIVEKSQLVILKPVSRSLVNRFLRAAHEAGVRVVVNYMTRLPGESPSDAAAGLQWIRSLAESTGAVVEHHVFELERRAPLARSLRATGEWPWASVLGWDPALITEAA